MIIGKKDKEKMKQLESTIKLQEQNIFENMLKSDLMQLIKAIINKFDEQEITVSLREIENAKEYELYVTDEYFRRAKRYQLVNPKKILNSFKEKSNEKR